MENKEKEILKVALDRMGFALVMSRMFSSFVGAVLATICTSLLVGLFVKLLLNSLIVSLGPLSPLVFYAPVTYWQSVKLVLLCSFLFKGCSVKS